MSWLTAEYLGVEVWQFGLAALVISLTVPFKQYLETKVLKRILRLFSVGKYQRKLADALDAPIGALIYLGALHLVIYVLGLKGHMSQDLSRWLRYTYYLLFAFILVWTIYRLIDVVILWIDDHSKKQESNIGQFVPLIKQTMKIIVFVTGTLIILSALDIDVTGFVAGLGIGGIAVALAAKDSLGNFFGSIGILTDRPFDVGDWIKVGEKWEGYVEEIGFRSTKVRTLPKTLLTVPNQVLANEVVDNLSKRPKRRVKQTIGVTYDTPRNKLPILVKRFRQILEEDPGIHPEFILVRFVEFGASALELLLIYFTTGTSGQEHYAARERVNLQFMDCMAEMGISVAFPTRTIYMEQGVKDEYPDDGRLDAEGIGQ